MADISLNTLNKNMLTGLLTKQEVARRLHLTTRTVDRLVETGRIPFLTVPTATGSSRRVRFDPEAIDEWLNNKGSESA